MPNLLLHTIQHAIAPKPIASESAMGATTRWTSLPEIGMTMLPDHIPNAALPHTRRPIAQPRKRLRTTYGASMP